MKRFLFLKDRTKPNGVKSGDINIVKTKAVLNGLLLQIKFFLVDFFLQFRNSGDIFYQNTTSNNIRNLECELTKSMVTLVLRSGEQVLVLSQIARPPHPQEEGVSTPKTPKKSSVYLYFRLSSMVQIWMIFCWFWMLGQSDSPLFLLFRNFLQRNMFSLVMCQAPNANARFDFFLFLR